MSAEDDDPFLALIGFADPLGVDFDGVYYFDSLRWRFDPGRELSRFAMQARAAFGDRISFDELRSAARIALDSVDTIAADLATKYRVELGRPDMDPRDLLSLHGPADLLASARIWSRDPMPNFYVRESGEIATSEGSDLLHKRPGDPFDGRRILAAFSLLTADHAADASHRGEHGMAVEFMAIAGTALMHATRSEAQAAEARRQFECASAKWRAFSASGGEGKKEKLIATKRTLQGEYRQGLASGTFKSANHAATKLQFRALALSRDAGAPLSEDRVQKTVANWFREVDADLPGSCAGA